MFYEYKKDFDTCYTSIDRSGKLGLVESMDINQDMITEFFGSVGSDNRILRKNNNAAWIYTRTKMHIEELPFWNTKTHARTFVSAKSPIRFELETQLCDDRAKLLFVAKTEMCAIDFVQRKIKKISELTFPADLETGESLISEAFSKLKAEFTDDERVLSEKVYASDTDFTHHTNNTRYVKYLMNTFDSAFYDTKTITDFEIQFAKESTEGAVLDIFKKESEDKTFDFQIRSGSDVIAKALMKYSDEARTWQE